MPKKEIEYNEQSEFEDFKVFRFLVNFWSSLLSIQSTATEMASKSIWNFNEKFQQQILGFPWKFEDINTTSFI